MSDQYCLLCHLIYPNLRFEKLPATVFVGVSQLRHQRFLEIISFIKERCINVLKFLFQVRKLRRKLRSVRSNISNGSNESVTGFQFEFGLFNNYVLLELFDFHYSCNFQSLTSLVFSYYYFSIRCTTVNEIPIYLQMYNVLHSLTPYFNVSRIQLISVL